MLVLGCDVLHEFLAAQRIAFQPVLMIGGHGVKVVFAAELIAFHSGTFSIVSPFFVGDALRTPVDPHGDATRGI
jgi:hypothetical protein